MCLPCFGATSFFSCFTKKSSVLQLPKFRNKFIYENVLLLTLHLQKICLLRNEVKMLHDLLLFSEEIMSEIFTLFGGALTEDAIVLKQVIESEIVGDDNKQLRKIFFAIISNSLIIRNPNLLLHYLISAYYFLRSKPVADKKPGSRWSAQVLVDSKIYELVLVVKAKETIETEAGNRSSIKTNILLPKNNLFKEEDAIRLWISDDEYQVPLKVQVNLKIGFLTIDLVDYSIQGKKIYFPKASL